MRLGSRKIGVSPRRLFVVLGLVSAFLLSMAVYYEATALSSPSPPSAGAVQPTSTPHPPTGRRWFWQRSFWLPPPGPSE